jgi:undecaprenyl-diphosphatase
MTIFQAVVLGIVQGLTEFLPVSSSAHLVLLPWWLGWSWDPDVTFTFDVLVQLGTLVGVMVFFARDLLGLVVGAWNGLLRRRPFETPEARRAWFIVVATVPAVIAGLALKESVERAFASPAATSAFLLVTAAILFVAERLAHSERSLDSMTWRESLWIGVAQAVSLFPGVSRSGATMGAGRALGFRRQEAARFSFLMSVPVMLGAGVLAAKDFASIPDPSAHALPLLAGFVAAAVVGYLSIRWMLAFVGRRPLTAFAVYCVLVGLAGLATAVWRG